MASATVSQGPWPQGTTVGAYPAGAFPAGQDAPTGTAVATAVAGSNGAASFTGLTEGLRYRAWVTGYAPVAFTVVTAAAPQFGDRHRIETLEASSSDQGGRLLTVETGKADWTQIAVNLRHHGARGIGTSGSAADTSALINARAEAQATGKAIYIPAGEDPTLGYVFTQPLLIRSGTAATGTPSELFYGDGHDQTKLRFIYGGETEGVIRPANPALFTDSVTFRDLAIHGNPSDTTQMPIGAFLASCRHWLFDRVEFQYFNSYPCWLYGQRYLDGTIDTATTAKSTLSATLAAGDATATLVDASQYQPSGYLSIDGEVIKYSGKSTNTLTGLTRGLNGTTAASHAIGAQAFSCPGDSTYNELRHPRLLGGTNPLRLGGTDATSRADSGTSNMNKVTAGRANTATAEGLWIEKGAANEVSRFTAVQCTGDGMKLSWYGNTLIAPILENNGGWGLHFTNDAQCHDNYAIGVHDGGSNVSGLYLDEPQDNYVLTKGHIHLPLGVFAGTTPVTNNSIHSRPDGHLRWKSNDGDDFTVTGGPQSVQGITASLGAAATSRVWAATLPTNSTVLVWAAAACSGIGGLATGFAVDIFDEVGATTLWSSASASSNGKFVKGAPLTRLTGMGGKRISVRAVNGSAGASAMSVLLAFTVLDV